MAWGRGGDPATRRRGDAATAPRSARRCSAIITNRLEIGSAGPAAVLTGKQLRAEGRDDLGIERCAERAPGLPQPPRYGVPALPGQLAAGQPRAEAGGLEQRRQPSVEPLA